MRCSSLLCVNFTQIEFNPIDPSAGRAPESSPPDTRSPSSARGGALPRPSRGDKQAACAITDPAALAARVRQHAHVRETTWMRLNPARISICCVSAAPKFGGCWKRSASTVTRVAARVSPRASVGKEKVIPDGSGLIRGL